MQAFHRRLHELLGKRGPDATQAWLSERSGVDRSLISRLMSGDRLPTAETLICIAPALEVTVEQLVGGEYKVVYPFDEASTKLRWPLSHGEE